MLTSAFLCLNRLFITQLVLSGDFLKTLCQPTNWRSSSLSKQMKLTSWKTKPGERPFYLRPNGEKTGLILLPLCLFSILEKKLMDMEEQKQVDLKALQDEKEQLETLILRQTAIIGEMEEQLLRVSSNNTFLQQQQQELLDTVNGLIQTISAGSVPGQATLPVRSN